MIENQFTLKTIAESFIFRAILICLEKGTTFLRYFVRGSRV